MKYMGSKLSLLDDRLGAALQQEVHSANRFVDLFCGTGRVSWFVAQSMPIPVLASDLQEYAVVLAGAVIDRDYAVDVKRVIDCWLDPARKTLPTIRNYRLATANSSNVDADIVYDARRLCARVDGGTIWRAYGGHYFSPQQAVTFDHLIGHLPPNSDPLSSLCRASLVLAASQCAAAPGHTAQPFQPSVGALPFIRTSWHKDPIGLIPSILKKLASSFALVQGEALVADANIVVTTLNEGDVVFVDPPYSDVQYSRFYHVLETIARGSCGPVSGVGRYPPQIERPRSQYSLKSQASIAMTTLLQDLANTGCRVVLTFPFQGASNGVDGQGLVDMAKELFEVDICIVHSRFSTLGGNGYNRRARQPTKELLLTMRPHS